MRKTVSGMVKLLYPDGKFTKEDVAQILTFAMEMRRRVKEQLKKIGGMEFYDVNFSYIDKETYDEHFVPVPEQGSTGLIPENEGKPGQVYTVAYDADERLSLIKLESQMTTGNGKTSWTGIQSNRLAKEEMDTAFNYLKANFSQVSQNIAPAQHDYIVNATNLNNDGHGDGIVVGDLCSPGFYFGGQVGHRRISHPGGFLHSRDYQKDG